MDAAADSNPRSGVKRGEVVVRCTGVSKWYGERQILHGVDLEVRKGETLVIMGGSGHGKSTLLRLLIGVEKPDGGNIELFGSEITALAEEKLYPIKRRFGVLFQSGALYNSMTVGDNIALPLREHTSLDEKIIAIIVKLKLELVGLRDFEHLMPSEISGTSRVKSFLRNSGCVRDSSTWGPRVDCSTSYM